MIELHFVEGKAVFNAALHQLGDALSKRSHGVELAAMFAAFISERLQSNLKGRVRLKEVEKWRHVCKVAPLARPNYFIEQLHVPEPMDNVFLYI